MQLTFLVPSPNHHWGAIHGILWKRSATFAHWKTWVFKNFHRKLAGEKLTSSKNFGPDQLRPCQSRLAIIKRILQTRLKKMSIKFEKRSGQGGTSTISKKLSVSLDENWAEKNWRKILQHATQLNDVPSTSSETMAFSTYCRDRTQTYSLCPFKNPEKINFR